MKRPKWGKQSISHSNVPRMEKKGLNGRHWHGQAVAHSLFMLMIINSGHLGLKIWLSEMRFPLSISVFSLQRSNDKNGIVFRELKAWFVYATSHSILNPWSVLLSSMLKKQFVSRQCRISSLFTKTSFSPSFACYPHWVSRENSLNSMPISDYQCHGQNPKQFDHAGSFHCHFLSDKLNIATYWLPKPELLRTFFISHSQTQCPRCTIKAVTAQINQKLKADILKYYYLVLPTVTCFFPML